jgi:hypothetical protein
MGVYMTSYVEILNGDVWTREPWEPLAQFENGPFEHQYYGVFGWLADVRNYAAIPPISEARGLPTDVSVDVSTEHANGCDAFCASWLTVDELLTFDYDQRVEDRRGDGGTTVPPGEGETTSLRDFLGDPFFRDLDVLRALSEKQPTRIVFWFD